MDRKIRARLADFADRLKGPLGAIPLDRVIRNDLELFSALRESGATWPQIAHALAAVGARRPNGDVISADHLRSAVSRQLKDSVTAELSDAAVTATAQAPKQTVGRSEHKPSTRQKAPTPPSARKPSAHNPLATTKLPQKKSANLGHSSVLQKLARTRQLRES